MSYNGTSWTGTGSSGGSLSETTYSLAYDPTDNLLYAGVRKSPPVGGVWKYDGTTWTNTGGALSNSTINCLAYDTTHHLLYAGLQGAGVFKYDGTNWTNTNAEVPNGLSPNSLVYDSTHNLLYAGGEPKRGLEVQQFQVKGRGPTGGAAGELIQIYMTYQAYT